jgi:NAD(P)-dependent dehydrogenase (short-subunit alcohol dehydrogenase family)
MSVEDGLIKAWAAAYSLLHSTHTSRNQERTMDGHRPDVSVALVTGAGRSRGIGFEVARELAQRGVRVVLTARDRSAAEARAAELRAEHLDVVATELDVTDTRSVDVIARLIERDFGRLDILVNNAAGMSPYGEKAAAADLVQAQQVLDATLFGAWRVSQALLPLMQRSAHPRLVNVSSGAGSHGDAVFGLTTANAMGTGYAVAKAALNALTVKLANENPAIRINAVCPGFTATFDGGEQMGARPVREGAASVVWAALLDDDGPTGGFFRDGRALPW